MYYLQYSANVDLPVAHAYEHAVITNLLDFLSERGVDGLISADIRGETFQSIILIYDEAGESDTEGAMSEYFSKRRRLNLRSLENAIKTISCEDGATYRIEDHQELAKQVSSLNDAWFERLDDLPEPIRTAKADDTEPTSRALAVDATARFATYTVNYTLNCETPMEMLLAGDLYPVLMARLNSGVMCHGYYKSCDVIDDYDDGDLGVMMAADIVAPANTDETQIEKIAREAMAAFPPEADIKRYNKRPYKPNGTTYDYLSLGVLAPYSRLAKHLDYDELKRIWSRIELSDIVMSTDDRQRALSPIR